jgi:isoamyl acetate esterase
MLGVLFGDSITEQNFLPYGWGAMLANAFVRHIDVVNRGFGGYNTRDALACIDSVIESLPKADIGFITIFFGTNDACLAGHEKHVPLDEYETNVYQIVERMGKLVDKDRLILITPPKVDENILGSTIRTDENTKLYAKRVRKVGRDMGVKVLDVSSNMNSSVDWRGMLSDGLHLNEKGNVMVGIALNRLVKQIVQ